MDNQVVNIDELSAHIGSYVGKLIMENFLLRQQVNDLANALNQQMQANSKEPKQATKEPVK